MKTCCPSCGQNYDVENECVGQNVECTCCKAKFIVKPFVQSVAQPQQKSSVKAAKPTMKEYKVLTQNDKWFGGKFNSELLEQAINAYAQQG